MVGDGGWWAMAGVGVKIDLVKPMADRVAGAGSYANNQKELSTTAGGASRAELKRSRLLLVTRGSVHQMALIFSFSCRFLIFWIERQRRHIGHSAFLLFSPLCSLTELSSALLISPPLSSTLLSP